jgi:hypothetical protein
MEPTRYNLSKGLSFVVSVDETATDGAATSKAVRATLDETDRDESNAVTVIVEVVPTAENAAYTFSVPEEVSVPRVRAQEDKSVGEVVKQLQENDSPAAEPLTDTP